MLGKVELLPQDARQKQLRVVNLTRRTALLDDFSKPLYTYTHTHTHIYIYIYHNEHTEALYAIDTFIRSYGFWSSSAKLDVWGKATINLKIYKCRVEKLRPLLSQQRTPSQKAKDKDLKSHHTNLDVRLQCN